VAQEEMMPTTLVRRPTGPLAPIETVPSDQAAETERDVEGYRSLGVSFLMLVTTESGSDCPTCAGLAGHIYRMPEAPRPPIAGCAGDCTCRLAPLALE
jgi:hypothetical protein